MLAESCGFLADHVAVLVGELRVEGRGHADGLRQGSGGRAWGAVAHAYADRAVGDAEPGDTQLFNALDMALQPNLGGKLLHLLGRLALVGQVVDIDSFHLKCSWMRLDVVELSAYFFGEGA